MEESKEEKRWSILTWERMSYPISAVWLIQDNQCYCNPVPGGQALLTKPCLLSLGTGAIWGWVVLCCEGLSCVLQDFYLGL